MKKLLIKIGGFAILAGIVVMIGLGFWFNTLDQQIKRAHNETIRTTDVLVERAMDAYQARVDEEALLCTRNQNGLDVNPRDAGYAQGVMDFCQNSDPITAIIAMAPMLRQFEEQIVGSTRDNPIEDGR